MQGSNGKTYIITEDFGQLEQIMQDDQIIEQKMDEVINELKASNNGSCVNGKTGLSTKDQLLEFVQGPCSPFVVSPGLFASKLTVKIDCEVLKSESRFAFDACGWTDCVGINAPKTDYLLWLAEFQGRLDGFLALTSGCWANLIELQYNSTEPDLNKRFISIPGVEVYPYGVADAYKDKAQCGFGAASDLFPTPIQLKETIGFRKVMERFLDLGYQLGLTLYCAPYDWRKTTVVNNVSVLLNETVKQAYNLTGKPVVLISHSLGNFGVQHLLNTMPLALKDQMIANWISFMPPLLGAGKVSFAILGGDPGFVVNEFFGIPAQSQKQLLQTCLSATDVYPKDVFEKFAGQPWLEEWAQRQALEDAYSPLTADGKAKWEEIVNSGNFSLKYFPTPLTNCTKGFTQRSDYC